MDVLAAPLRAATSLEVLRMNRNYGLRIEEAELGALLDGGSARAPRAPALPAPGLAAERGGGRLGGGPVRRNGPPGWRAVAAASLLLGATARGSCKPCVLQAGPGGARAARKAAPLALINPPPPARTRRLQASPACARWS